ncbi:AraC family transcriptional regulator [Nonomuraea candida]|uniref:AraC family transcriptional regulator n=1 Tax=Nonomuraea candida TaxID=359159 RepID=UPI00069451A1|nr:AraC family transcriptional regulator [Nonomuraea candida]
MPVIQESGLVRDAAGADGPAYTKGTHLSLGPVLAMRKSFVPEAQGWWRVADVRRDAEFDQAYQIMVPLTGSLHAVCADRHVSSGAGQLVMHDLARMTSVAFRGPARRESFETAAVMIPKPMLPLPGGQLDAMMGSNVSARDGIGGLLADFVTRLTHEPDAYRASDGPRIGMVLVDLVTALVAHAVDGRSAVPPSNRDVLVMRIQAFVQEHLRDPAMTPRALAVQHHISTSYLHRLFQERGLTVGGYIRTQRLERARRDLADPALGSVPIHNIAARWGFSHAADFSRAFRRAYGVSPKDFRLAAHG